MGSFLDHLEDAARQERALRQRERRERTEIREDYEKRSAARGEPRIRRSTPAPTVPIAPDEG